MKPSHQVAKVLLASIFLTLLASPAPGEDRALLIGAGRYASTKWELPSVEENLRIFEKSLVAEVGVPSTNIRTIVDAAVTRTGVMRALREISREAASGDRLFIYFSGHASKVFVGSAPVRAFFTWDTIEADDGAGFDIESLITDLDLKRWTRPLKDKGVLVIVVREACFSGGGYSQDIATFAPGLPPSRQLAGQIEFSACDAGQAAWVLDGVQPSRALFTAAIVEVLGSDMQKISFQTLYEAVNDRVKLQQNGQRPVLDCDASVNPREVVLVDRTLIDLVVEVNDATTGRPLHAATVVVAIPGEDQEWQGTGPRARLHSVPRRGVLYPWIELSGYVSMSKRIEIAPKERVVHVRADLEPELALIVGQLEVDGPGSLAGVRIAYESGAKAGDARHVDSEVRPRGDGTFNLNVPAGGPCRVLIVKGAETLAAIDLEGGKSLDPARYFDRVSESWLGKTYDIGLIRVKLQRAAPVLTEAEQVFEDYLNGAEDAEERGDLEESLRFYKLALEAAGMISDRRKRIDLTCRAVKAVEKIEAGLVSNRYVALVNSGKGALNSGDIEEARRLANEALQINSEGVMAQILLWGYPLDSG